MLLLDQNLPRALAKQLGQVFPGTVHVTELDMERETDTAIWTYARERGLVIVSKDSDFYDRLTIKGSPPKLIWVRTGNVSTAFLLELFRVHRDHIDDFLKDKEATCLEIL